MKEINLEEILLSKIPKDCYWEEMGNLTNCPKEYVLSAMKEACNQCLVLAAENAALTLTTTEEGDKIYVSKQSILQIKDWIE